MDKTNFIFNNDNIDEFRAIISDLSKINVTIKLKMDKDSLLLYSIASAGESSNASHSTALAVKTYTFPFDYFMKLKHYDEDDDTRGNIDWIIRNGTILNKKFNFFHNGGEIKGVFNLRKMSGDDEVKYTRNVIMSDNKFKFSITGDEPHVIRDITVSQLGTILDPSLSEVSIDIPTSEFIKARSVSNIEPEDLITIHMTEGNVFFRQSSWELLVAKTDFKGDKRVSFDKKYLKSINPTNDNINLEIFNAFMLFKENNQNLIISYEKSF